jgi:hypothetical protein
MQQKAVKVPSSSPPAASQTKNSANQNRYVGGSIRYVHEVKKNQLCVCARPSSHFVSPVREKNLVHCRILTRKKATPERRRHKQKTKQLLGIIGMESDDDGETKKKKRETPRKRRETKRKKKTTTTMASRFAKSSPSPSQANLSGCEKIRGWSPIPRFPVVQ